MSRANRILVIFGTTDGHTRKVAERLGHMLGAQGVDVDVIEAGTVDVHPSPYDGVVVCASIHAGGYQRSVIRWASAHAHELVDTPSAFVSVCLAVLQKDPKVQRELDAIVRRFEQATRWRPTIVKYVAGALQYRQYGFIKRWIMKRIVAKAGGDIDTSRDYEYTDWNDLQTFAGELGRLIAPEPAAIGTAAGF